MRNALHRKTSLLSSPDKTSEKILMDKMGLSKKEIREVSTLYGVSATKLVELMTLSKYQFVYSGKVDGQCEPCHHLRSLSAVGF